MSTKGFVNIYPYQGSPTRAKASQALITLNFDEDALAADTDTVPTGEQGQFAWQSAPSKPTVVRLSASVSEQPGQYQLKKVRSFSLHTSDVDLKEVRLFDVRRAAQELFAEELTALATMRAEHPCLQLGQRTLEQIWSCWSANPSSAKKVRAKILDALARLQAIANHPQQTAVVRERMSLMTSAAMFCAQADLGGDQDWIDLRDGMVQDQAESLMYCAQGLSVDPVPLTFSEVRTFLRSHLDRVGPAVQRRLLRIWLDSYFREAKEAELVKLATWMNQNGLAGEWLALLTQASQSVPNFPPFFDSTVTAAQIAAVRTALNS
ncbi:hypothetical protein H5407_13140 [Mitsuaria sp. WAJ17]|uniref:hypothetical protein n=1 Tax=Mitsuaria sp. WAJ17 TaxID=2761452 RepID=UPI0016001D2E|nr:hypothetical protein [Mitsuaria sp. WAJ17]MBB2486162.1 hypothetical protein [Mitsuaria sp. WAJ17]